MPKMKKPAFSVSYVCPGDSIEWEAEGYTLTATIESDWDSRPEDSECYTARQINAWKRDEWHFVGVVISVALNGVTLSEHASSLWGIECNFPKKGANKYLTEVAYELEGEALEVARKEQARIIQALTKEAA